MKRLSDFRGLLLQLMRESRGLFTVEELTSGAYETKYPDVNFVDYGSAGYDPETFSG